eukprot:CAMPEP_0180377512 /NCGR_PEP_ID=MMETSP0989-20121125/24149_1 /TAXON_ID=697907 /ORGANISM="non described non described, Strain CCMP2293" /LENGTH=45 /DNA_ID= /DNA_START= /DNA_END= /DNA_ORIENTATION=
MVSPNRLGQNYPQREVHGSLIPRSAPATADYSQVDKQGPRYKSVN